LAVVFEVEGAEGNTQAEGCGGDERVKQADSVREVQAAKVSHSLERFGVGRLNERKVVSKFVYGECLPLILCILIKLHENMTGQRQTSGGSGGIPGDGGREAALNINQHISIQKAYSLGDEHHWPR
jgi:hypothetical protein